ncbi:Bacterial regulatory protein, arsR family [uncultured archaeon]|nr:Bacterial regulatory protein, arsR family [uncultured archaeon]
MNKKPCEATYNIFFTNLANPLKISIILSLRKKEKNVSELVDELKVEQSKISHALKCLKECKIVKAEADGKSRVYSLNRETILPMLELIDKHSALFCKNKCCMVKK